MNPVTLEQAQILEAQADESSFGCLFDGVFTEKSILFIFDILILCNSRPSSKLEIRMKEIERLLPGIKTQIFQANS